MNSDLIKLKQILFFISYTVQLIGITTIKKNIRVKPCCLVSNTSKFRNNKIKDLLKLNRLYDKIVQNIKIGLLLKKLNTIIMIINILLS